MSYTFSGFLTARVPFPLTLRFKQLMQRGIDLGSLDASWISSMSWYFIGAFGMRGLFKYFYKLDFFNFNIRDFDFVFTKMLLSDGNTRCLRAGPWGR